MDEVIDGIQTYDFRFSQLGSERNVLLNKRDATGNIDVVIFGAKISPKERVLLTMTGDQEVDTAWLVVSSEARSDTAGKTSYHCTLKFEGTVTL